MRVRVMDRLRTKKAPFGAPSIIFSTDDRAGERRNSHEINLPDRRCAFWALLEEEEEDARRTADLVIHMSETTEIQNASEFIPTNTVLKKEDNQDITKIL